MRLVDKLSFPRKSGITKIDIKGPWYWIKWSLGHEFRQESDVTPCEYACQALT